jgi:hypothetical protein
MGTNEDETKKVVKPQIDPKTWAKTLADLKNLEQNLNNKDVKLETILKQSQLDMQQSIGELQTKVTVAKKKNLL